jgi:hypothetical protein
MLGTIEPSGNKIERDGEICYDIDAVKERKDGNYGKDTEFTGHFSQSGKDQQATGHGISCEWFSAPRDGHRV